MHLFGEGGIKLFRVASRYNVGLFVNCTLEYGGGGREREREGMCIEHRGRTIGDRATVGNVHGFYHFCYHLMYVMMHYESL
jgi:hypothetical protein